MPSPAAQQTGTQFLMSRRFVITWCLFAVLWAAWVLFSNLSTERLAPLYAEAPLFPDRQTLGEGAYAEALTVYGLHRMERNDALDELWSLIARACGPPVVIVALLVIADMGGPRLMDTVNGATPRKSASGAVKIALLLWATLSAFWIASVVLRLGPARILSSPGEAFAPPIVTLLIGLFLYGITLPVRDRA